MQEQIDPSQEMFQQFGFRAVIGGAHLARTMMLGELRSLLAHVGNPTATHSDYANAVTEANCLGKRSAESRRLTLRHLTSLYGLDPSIPIFRALLYFWNRDPASHPLLALLCASRRDAILRSSAPFILATAVGAVVSCEATMAYLDDLDPGRFSKVTLHSAAKNINATWTQSGHLTGRAKKIRTRAAATPGSAAFALLLGYMQGNRGQGLLQSEEAKLLDCPYGQVLTLTEEAARKGWVTMNRIEDVIQVSFPRPLLACGGTS
jgi:hypothetical protein